MIRSFQPTLDEHSHPTPLGFRLIERRWEESKVNVFLAQEIATEEIFLLKASKIRRADKNEFEQLRRDYEIAGALPRHGIVRTSRFFTHEGFEYLALENDQAVPVAELFAHEALDLPNILQLGAGLAETIHQLHAAGYIHNNLTPFSVWYDLRRRQTKVTDFSLAEKTTESPARLRQQIRLSVNLNYISPEQTGRIGHAVDFRSDLYAIGVLLYEALTGAPPFDELDALGLIHAHLARTPATPRFVKPEIPEPVSDIVMKLLVKGVEGRYQSAKSLSVDLEECLLRWRLNGKIDSFPLASRDVSSTFRVSGELYGREHEVALLRAAIGRAAAGGAELILVTGPAGVGKSRLVRQAEPFARAIGSFVTTKFDQFRINQPYSFITQALRDLVQQMLSRSDSAVTFWKNRLLNALGPNGQIIVDLIPELELVIGPQPTVEELPPTEKRNRFIRVFQSFMAAFLRKDNPLYVFLDDLQWADVASIELLTALLTDSQTQNFLVIAAFRTEDGALPLSSPGAMSDLSAQGVSVSHIALTNLELDDVNNLLKDTLRCPSDESRQLAQLLRQKTAGNPFFLRQFLSFVHREQLIHFDYQRNRWEWDLRAISAKGVTDDVLELMSRKLASLPASVQDVLRTAACLGNEFDARRLALVTDFSESAVLESLMRAELEGLIVQTGSFAIMEPGESTIAPLPEAPSFRFLHDRMQQAAYSLTPENLRPTLRLRIGEALLAEVPPDQYESAPFAIVDNLNEGAALITEDAKRACVACLNLYVGQRAREAAAYDAALDYFRRGMALLSINSWRDHYELTRDLHLARFECAYVTGRTEEANALFQEILDHAKSRIEMARAYYTKILLTTGVEHSEKAVSYGVQALRLFGETLPTAPTQVDLFKALFLVLIELRGRRARDLANLPDMTDPDRKAVMELLMSICPAAYFKNPDLMALAALRIMRLSLRYGNASASSFGYVLYGLICAAILGRHKTGHEFGRLAVDLANANGGMIQRCKITMIFAGFINFWREPIDTSIEMSFESLKLGLDAGDVQYANYSILQIIFLGLARGANLDEVRSRCKDYESMVAQTKDTFAIANIELRRQFVLALQDTAKISVDLDRDGYDEQSAVASFIALGNLTTMSYYYVLKTELYYIFGEFDHAFAYSRLADANVKTALGQIVVAEHYFYQGLAAAALIRRGSLAAAPLWRALRRSQSKLRKWALNCPANFRHHFQLLTAEIAVLKSDYRSAELWCDKAIQSAQEFRFLHVEAMANELACRIYLQQGRRQVAKTYLEASRLAYIRWGAKAKVRLLERTHPELLDDDERQWRPMQRLPSTLTQSPAADLFDFDTLVRASAEISREFHGDQLASKLMRLILECAGGDRGLLIMREQDALSVRAIVAESGHEALLLSNRSGVSEHDYSLSIVNYALRTSEAISLEDAKDDPRFSACAYLSAKRPRSTICLPLVKQGVTIGAIYLENGQVAANFTHNRVQALSLLSHQVCVLIENTDLSQRLSDNAISLQGALKNIALLERMKEHLEKFVPTTVQKLIEKNPQQPDLETRFEDVSVMFLDMSGYTALSEKMPSDELNAVVETYFSSFFDDIHSNGGDISEVAGDGLMIIFQDDDLDRHAVSAVRASLAVRDKTAALNRKLSGRWPTVTINVGVHSGDALLGAHKMQGATGTKRWTFTVTGFAANLAARIRTFAVDGAVVVSGETAARVQNVFSLRKLGIEQFKGVSGPVELFSVEYERTTRLGSSSEQATTHDQAHLQ